MLQDVGTSLGGSCSRAVKPQQGPAGAGLECMCRAAELPAQPLMGKACGRTSGSDRGNTQSIIRASGFLHCLAPASARPAWSAAASPAARRAHGAAGRGGGISSGQRCRQGSGQGVSHSRSCPWAPLSRAAPAGLGRRMHCGFGWQRHTQCRGLQPLGRGFHQALTLQLSRHCLGIACLGALVPSLGAEGVDMAPGQREGSRASSSLGVTCKRGFSAQLPRCCHRHLAPAPTRTCRARPSEVVDKQQPWGRAEQMPTNPSHSITIWSRCYL